MAQAQVDLLKTQNPTLHISNPVNWSSVGTTKLVKLPDGTLTPVLPAEVVADQVPGAPKKRGRKPKDPNVTDKYSDFKTIPAESQTPVETPVKKPRKKPEPKPKPETPVEMAVEEKPKVVRKRKLSVSEVGDVTSSDEPKPKKTKKESLEERINKMEFVLSGITERIDAIEGRLDKKTLTLKQPARFTVPNFLTT